MNLKKRAKNKAFWLTLIPALLLLAKQIVALFGVELEIDAVEHQTVELIDTIFCVMACVGVTIDPTTPGIKDGDKNE